MAGLRFVTSGWTYSGFATVPTSIQCIIVDNLDSGYQTNNLFLDLLIPGGPFHFNSDNFNQELLTQDSRQLKWSARRVENTLLFMDSFWKAILYIHRTLVVWIFWCSEKIKLKTIWWKSLIWTMSGFGSVSKACCNCDASEKLNFSA